MSKQQDKKKGDNENGDRYKGDAGNFTSLDADDGPGPQKCNNICLQNVNSCRRMDSICDRNP